MERIVLGLMLCACPLVVGIVAWPSGKAPLHAIKPTRPIFAEPANERRVLLEAPSETFDPDTELVATEAPLPEPQPAPALAPGTLEMHGRVQPREGEPKAGWRITLIDAEPLGGSVTALTESVRAQAPLESARDGSFTIRGLRSAEYIVTAWRARDHHIDLIASARTRPGAAIIDLEAPSSATEHIAVQRFVDAAGVPFAGMRVGLPGWPACTTTDDDGKLELAGALPARIVLVLTGADGKETLQEIEPLLSRDFVLAR